ncbi:MAG TPA: transglutaminase family protein [Polyangiales bacterium]|nr:transglutaminase family protein [Polyangiales bacterium]
MLIRVGYELVYSCPQPTPMVLTLNIHYSRANDLVKPDTLDITPATPVATYRDSFGNWCVRTVLPVGVTRLHADAIVRDSGYPEAVPQHQTPQIAVQALPEDTLLYLLGSRYCDIELLNDTAWSLFGGTPLGYPRVQAVCDYVHRHVRFGYEFASPTRTAFQTWQEGRGVCRDYAHLAIAFLRCLNIPARYCTGYLGDIGVPIVDAPMDFAACIEVYLGDRWWTFDPRNNQARIGRVLIARGRDAADVALSTSFGPNTLQSFFVVAEETTN